MEDSEQGRSLMDRTGLGLLPGLVLALGLVVFAMAALMTGSMWAVAGVLAILALATIAVLMVVIAVIDDGPRGARLRARIPGLREDRPLG